MLEKKFQTTFNHWARSYFKGPAVFELKVANGKSLAFNKLQPHQEQALIKANEDGFMYKIPDLGNQNPFDCVHFAKLPAFVVILFTIEKKFVLITIKNWLENKKESERKSITYEIACEIGTVFSLKP